MNKINLINKKISKSFYLGIHINENHFKNLLDALKYTKKIGGNILQVYLGDKRLTTLRLKIKLTKDEINEIKIFLKENNMKLVIHAILSLNYCNDPFSPRFKWGLDNLIYDMNLGYQLGALGVVLHMGTHKTEKLNISYDKCIYNFIESIKFVIDNTKKIPILLETPVNRKNIVGGTLEGMANIYNKIPIKYRKRIKICVDTQHIFVSGYNLRNIHIVKNYFENFNKLINIKNLGLIHLNDSEKEFNSKINRHITTQKGFIFSNNGKYSLKYILNYAYNKNIPLVLETDYDYYKDELKNLKLLKKQKGSSKKDIKKDILKIFNDLLSYYELYGNKFNKYRIESYKKAISTIKNFDKPIYNSNNIKDLPSIGKGMIEKINEISKTGHLKKYNNLIKNKKINKFKYSEHYISELKKIWGIGNSAIKKILDNKIYSIKELKKAVIKNKIKLTEQQTIGLKYYDDLNKRIPREEITKYTKILQKYIDNININNINDININNINNINDININNINDININDIKLYNAGSYRMGKKDSGDIDLIISINSTKNKIHIIQKLIHNILINNNILKDILLKGNEKCIYIVKLQDEKYCRQMDIAFIENKYLPWYLLYFGSSKDFSKKIRLIASKQGYKLNEKGLYNKKNGKRINFNPNNEKEIFEYLKIKYIKPEHRNYIII